MLQPEVAIGKYPLVGPVLRVAGMLSDVTSSGLVPRISVSKSETRAKKSGSVNLPSQIAFDRVMLSKILRRVTWVMRLRLHAP
jgi:hypothetical protein